MSIIMSNTVTLFTCVLCSSALKKEIEQIDKGELDSELPGMWEKAQA